MLQQKSSAHLNLYLYNCKFIFGGVLPQISFLTNFGLVTFKNPLCLCFPDGSMPYSDGNISTANSTVFHHCSAECHYILLG